MKDVADCDKPRGGVKQPLSRGCPNGAIHPPYFCAKLFLRLSSCDEVVTSKGVEVVRRNRADTCRLNT